MGITDTARHDGSYTYTFIDWFLTVSYRNKESLQSIKE